MAQDKPLSPPVAPALPPPAGMSSAVEAEYIKYLRRVNQEAEELAEKKRIEQETHKARQKMMIEAQEREHRNLALTQEACNHLKASGKTALAGMGIWDSHVPIYVCQNCLKQWTDPRKPPSSHLIPEANQVGKPSIGGIA